MQSSLIYVVSSDLLLFCLLRFFFDYEKTGWASVALCTNVLVQKIVLSMHVFFVNFYCLCMCVYYTDNENYIKCTASMCKNQSIL